MKRLILIPFAFIFGCVHMHVPCPLTGSIVVAVGGSQIGSQVITGVQAAAAAGMFGAVRGATSMDGAYVDYNYPAIFGPDYARCDVIPPPQPIPNPLPVQIVK